MGYTDRLDDCPKGIVGHILEGDEVKLHDLYRAGPGPVTICQLFCLATQFLDELFVLPPIWDDNSIDFTRNLPKLSTDTHRGGP